MTRGPTPVFDWAACGTAKQYRKHLRHKIPSCAACRNAESYRLWRYRIVDGDRVREVRRRYYAEHNDEINRKRRTRSRV